MLSMSEAERTEFDWLERGDSWDQVAWSYEDSDGLWQLQMPWWHMSFGYRLHTGAEVHRYSYRLYEATYDYPTPDNYYASWAGADFRARTVNNRDGIWDRVEVSLLTEYREMGRGRYYHSQEESVWRPGRLVRRVEWEITDQTRPAVRLESRDDLDIDPNGIDEWGIYGESEERPWDTNWMTAEWGEEQAKPDVVHISLGDGDFVRVSDTDGDGVWDVMRVHLNRSHYNTIPYEYYHSGAPGMVGIAVKALPRMNLLQDIAHLDLEVDELAYRPSAEDTDAYIINVLRELVPSDVDVEWSDEDGLKTVTMDFFEAWGRAAVLLGPEPGAEPEPEPKPPALPEPGPLTFAFDFHIDPYYAKDLALYYLGNAFDMAAAATGTDGRFDVAFDRLLSRANHHPELGGWDDWLNADLMDYHLGTYLSGGRAVLVPIPHQVNLAGVDVEQTNDSKGMRVTAQKEVNDDLFESVQTFDFVHDSVAELQRKAALVTDYLADPALSSPAERMTRIYEDQHTKGDGVTIVLNIFGASEIPSEWPTGASAADLWGW